MHLELDGYEVKIRSSTRVDNVYVPEYIVLERIIAHILCYNFSKKKTYFEDFSMVPQVVRESSTLDHRGSDC